MSDQSTAEPTVREEWVVTGEPSNDPAAIVPYPPYRFVFGNPNEAARDNGTTPEERARAFAAMTLKYDPTGWGGTIRLQSRIITETPWKDETL